MQPNAGAVRALGGVNRRRLNLAQVFEVFIVEQKGLEFLAHLPFHGVSQHAQEHGQARTRSAFQ